MRENTVPMKLMTFSQRNSASDWKNQYKNVSLGFSNIAFDRLAFLTGTADNAYKRKDGFCVVPIGCLKN